MPGLSGRSFASRISQDFPHFLMDMKFPSTNPNFIIRHGCEGMQPKLNFLQAVFCCRRRSSLHWEQKRKLLANYSSSCKSSLHQKMGNILNFCFHRSSDCHGAGWISLERGKGTSYNFLQFTTNEIVSLFLLKLLSSAWKTRKFTVRNKTVNVQNWEHEVDLFGNDEVSLSVDFMKFLKKSWNLH